MDPIIEIKNLTAGYQNTVAIEDISIQIEKGDFIGVVGPNGSGKTTLLKAILGLNTIFSGEIRIFGTKLTKKNRNKLGYVPQTEHLNSKFPALVRNIVLMGRYAFRKMIDQSPWDPPIDAWPTQRPTVPKIFRRFKPSKKQDIEEIEN